MRRSMNGRASIAGLLLVTATACSSSGVSDGTASPDAGGDAPTPASDRPISAVRCSGLLVQTCEKRGETSTWSDAAELLFVDLLAEQSEQPAQQEAFDVAGPTIELHVHVAAAAAAWRHLVDPEAARLERVGVRDIDPHGARA